MNLIDFIEKITKYIAKDDISIVIRPDIQEASIEHQNDKLIIYLPDSINTNTKSTILIIHEALHSKRLDIINKAGIENRNGDITQKIINYVEDAIVNSRIIQRFPGAKVVLEEIIINKKDELLKQNPIDTFLTKLYLDTQNIKIDEFDALHTEITQEEIYKEAIASIKKHTKNIKQYQEIIAAIQALVCKFLLTPQANGKSKVTESMEKPIDPNEEIIIGNDLKKIEDLLKEIEQLKAQNNSSKIEADIEKKIEKSIKNMEANKDIFKQMDNIHNNLNMAQAIYTKMNSNNETEQKINTIQNEIDKTAIKNNDELAKEIKRIEERELNIHKQIDSKMEIVIKKNATNISISPNGEIELETKQQLIGINDAEKQSQDAPSAKENKAIKELQNKKFKKLQTENGKININNLHTKDGNKIFNLKTHKMTTDTILNLIIDQSGSMEKENMETTAQIAEGLLKGIQGTRIKLNIQSFSSHHKILHEHKDKHFNKAQVTTLMNAIKWTGGGTQLEETIKYVIKNGLSKNPREKTINILITDGEIGDLGTIDKHFKHIDQRINKFFTLIINNDEYRINTSDIEKLNPIFIKNHNSKSLEKEIEKILMREVVN